MNGSDSVPTENEWKRGPLRSTVIAKRQGGGNYVLSMRDYPTNAIPGDMGLWPTQAAEPTEGGELPMPRPISGLCPLPAFFTVSGTGIDGVVTLELDRVPRDKRGRRSELTWVSVTVEGERRDPLPAEARSPRYRPRKALRSVPRLPLEVLLREAVKLCGVVGWWYPPGYEGDYWRDAEQTVRDAIPLLRADSEHGVALPVAWADSNDPIVRELSKAQRPPRVNSDPPERLKLVAAAYLGAASGERRQAVREALLQETGYEYSDDNVKRLITKSRQHGFIPPATKRGRQ